MPDYLNDFLGRPQPPAPAAPQPQGDYLGNFLKTPPAGQLEGERRAREAAARAEKVAPIVTDEALRGYGAGVSWKDEPDVPRFQARLREEVPGITDEEVEEHSRAFRELAPQIRRSKDLQWAVQGQREDWWEGKRGNLIAPATQQYWAEKAPFLDLVPKAATAADLITAAKHYREGTEDESDRAALARHLIVQEEEAKKGVGRKALDIAAALPGFVGELAMSGGLAKGATKGVESVVAKKLAEYGAQAAVQIPGKLAQNLMPDVGATPEGALQVGPEKSFGKEMGRSAAEAAIETAAMHGTGAAVGKLGSAGRAALGLKAAEPGLLAQGGFYGPAGFITQARAAELAEGLVGVKPDYGVAGDLFGDDHDKRSRAWQQVAAEAIAGGAVGGGEKALGYARQSRAEGLTRRGYSPQAAAEKAKADFAPLWEQLEKIKSEGAAGLGQLGQELAGQQRGMRTAGQDIADIYGRGFDGDWAAQESPPRIGARPQPPASRGTEAIYPGGPAQVLEDAIGQTHADDMVRGQIERGLKLGARPPAAPGPRRRPRRPRRGETPSPPRRRPLSQARGRRRRASGWTPWSSSTWRPSPACRTPSAPSARPRRTPRPGSRPTSPRRARSGGRRRARSRTWKGSWPTPATC